MDLSLLTKNLICQEDYSLVLGAIFNESKDGIFITDNVGTVVMLNKASESMLGINGQSAIGMNVKELVDQGFYNKSVALLAIEKRSTVSIIQTTHTNKKILTTGIPIFKDGELKYIFVNDRDITTLSSYISSLNEDELENREFHLDFCHTDLMASSIDDIIVKSPAMQGIVHMIEKAATTECPVLITGETGVGKSLFAKLIHTMSQRKNRKFLEVNCGAINENLYDSELFGYEKGAFTGASMSGKAGMIESADGGSLFLDEINNIPYYLQVKLLKFLDNAEVRRVGGTKQIQVNTRIIAAANQNLEQMVNSGDFRKDLYYRLNVIPIHIPPLRERPEEIEFLIDYFVQYYCQKYGLKKSLSPDAKLILSSFDYPGNVRELQNIIRQTLILSDKEQLTKLDLPDYVRMETETEHEVCHHSEDSQYKRFVSKYEADYIRSLVSRLGSQRKAAAALGVSQSTLSRKLKKRLDPYLIHK